MFKLSIKALFFFITLLFTFPSFAQVENDEIATATDIMDLPFTDSGVDFSQADTEGPVPSSTGTCFDFRPMVWYKFTFDLGADMLITVSSGLSNIIIYTSPDESATDFTNLVPLFSCSNRSSLAYVTAPGQSYYVLIANTSVIADISFTGTFIPPPNPPPNDDIATALEITEFPFTDPSVNFPDADTEGPIPAADGTCFDFRPMVWYKFIPSTDGDISVMSNLGSFIAVVYYTANDLNATSTDDLSPITNCSGSFGAVSTSLEANQAYYVMVGSFIEIDVIFEGTILLPVELNDFSGKSTENTIELTWQTLAEINNYGFTIEHLQDFSWEEIGFLNGQGTTSDPTDYAFIDRNPKSGENYYRLKQIDHDGIFSYSKFINVNFQASKNSVSIYPLPFKNVINVKFPKEYEGGLIQLIDLHGKVLITEEIADSEMQMDMSEIPSGNYFLKIATRKSQESYLVLKK